MPQISIGRNEPDELLLERLSHEAIGIAQAGIIISFQLRHIDGVSLIDYELDTHTLGEDKSWRKRLSEILAEMVLDLFETRLAEESLHRHYDNLPSEDLKKLSAQIKERLVKENGSRLHRRSERKALIVTRFLDNLEEFKERLDLDGFVRFRLKDYLRQIQAVVKEVVDDYQSDKEHREFIQLLRYFVELQKPKTDWVQVLMLNNGFFQILDRDNRPIHAEYLDGSASHINHQINYDDLLISALITIAPAHLMVHSKSFSNHETVNTISSVFEGRCTMCKGCSLCE